MPESLNISSQCNQHSIYLRDDFVIVASSLGKSVEIMLTPEKAVELGADLLMSAGRELAHSAYDEPGDS